MFRELIMEHLAGEETLMSVEREVRRAGGIDVLTEEKAEGICKRNHLQPKAEWQELEKKILMLDYAIHQMDIENAKLTDAHAGDIEVVAMDGSNLSTPSEYRDQQYAELVAAIARLKEIYSENGWGWTETAFGKIERRMEGAER